MSHNLFGDRFGDARQPAWHELGQVFPDEVSASEGLKRIGDYEVVTEPVWAGGVKLDKQAILRRPTTDDPETRCFGIVSNDYHLLTPIDVCTIWDERVAKPIETIGALGDGETFFLSTYLPSFDVKGDEMENYLLVTNPMTGLASSQILETPVRAVCQNTVTAADNLATQRLKIVHDKTAKERLGDWLQDSMQWAEHTALVLKDLFESMASARVKDAEARRLFTYAYPTPKRPDTNAPKHIMDQRVKWWEENVNLMERRREGAKMLFEGMGTGMDTKAAKGTVWGAYNAVVETEDYRKGRHNDQIASSSLFGERAASKKRAFEYAVKMVSSK
jgi:phage/plasmid-like protein (TIGR03299 family)